MTAPPDLGLPWKNYDDTDSTGRHEIVSMGRTIARVYNKGVQGKLDAEHIVRAANSFSALVGALKDCEATFQAWIEAANGSGALSDEELARMTRAVWTNCQAVLAAAGERT